MGPTVLLLVMVLVVVVVVDFPFFGLVPFSFVPVLFLRCFPVSSSSQDTMSLPSSFWLSEVPDRSTLATMVILYVNKTSPSHRDPPWLARYREQHCPSGAADGSWSVLTRETSRRVSLLDSCRKIGDGGPKKTRLSGRWICFCSIETSSVARSVSLCVHCVAFGLRWVRMFCFGLDWRRMFVCRCVSARYLDRTHYCGTAHNNNTAASPSLSLRARLEACASPAAVR